MYDCAVPVIAAVHGFCLGGGVGLAGNADIVIAADDATFGLPEVDRGALGAATHLSRLVPQQLMRAMVYTCRTVTAQELPASARCSTSCRQASSGRPRGPGGPDRRQGPGGHPAGQAVPERNRPGRRQAVLPIRAGLHLELNLTGVADKARQAFVDGQAVTERGREREVSAMSDDDVVIDLRPGMTIGIGGWGSRRKPMALVRAILRSGLRT